MGNTASLCRPKEEVPKKAFSQCDVRVHQYLFPMYVVKVSDFLKMDGAPEPHHVLQEKGLLHEWQPGMFVTFDLLMDQSTLFYIWPDFETRSWSKRIKALILLVLWPRPVPRTPLARSSKIPYDKYNAYFWWADQASTKLVLPPFIPNSRWFLSLTSGWEPSFQIPWVTKWTCCVKPCVVWWTSLWKWRRTSRVWTLGKPSATSRRPIWPYWHGLQPATVGGIYNCESTWLFL